MTEDNLPSQAGKVFVVTGGANGLGYELSRQLYGAGGKVYILTRSKERAESAISKIRSHYEAQDAKTQRGSLEFIPMDLMNFESVKVAARDFLALEGSNGRLDVLLVAQTSDIRAMQYTDRGKGSIMPAQELGAMLLKEPKATNITSRRMYSVVSAQYLFRTLTQESWAMLIYSCSVSSYATSAADSSHHCQRR